MGSPPFKLNTSRDGDRISALHDDLLLGILERLDLREAVRAGALSTRWRHLPYRLSRLHLNVGHFPRATLLDGMDAFKDAACRLLSVPPPPADCKSPRVIETLALTFCMSAPHLSSIGHAVDNMTSCRLVDWWHSALKIDTPHGGLEKLRFTSFRCTRIELISVPKVRTLLCGSWSRENPPVRFGYVPELRGVSLNSRAKAWQAPFALSECLSGSATKLSKLYLNFCYQMIWIKPEHPKELTATFSNLTSLGLFNIFPECDLSWTLFFLEVAPTLQKFRLCRTRHPCAEVSKDNTQKTNVVWEPSKDLKHLNMKLLIMFGFEEEEKVTNYIRLVMERAVGLKRIELCGKIPCNGCDAIGLESLRRSQADEASRHRIKEQLTHGPPRPWR